MLPASASGGQRRRSRLRLGRAEAKVPPPLVLLRPKPVVQNVIQKLGLAIGNAHSNYTESEKFGVNLFS